MSIFGRFIKTERAKRDLTQTEFGALIGINSSAISRIETGTQQFSKAKLQKLSLVLKIDLQTINNLFYADKFAREAYLNKCSEEVFTVAKDTVENMKKMKFSRIAVNN